MAKILLTGHRGHLGACVRQLAPEVDVLSGRLEDIGPGTLDYDYVIHCAGALLHRKDDLVSSNVGGMTSLLRGLKRRTKVLYVSSRAVYKNVRVAGDVSESIDETYSTETTDDYGKTKLEGERLLLASGHDFLVVRPGGFWGQGVSNFGDRRCQFPAKLLDLAFAGEPVTLFTPDRIVDYIDVFDLARTLLRLLNNDRAWNQIYHLAGQELSLHTFVKDFVEVFATKTGIQVPLRFAESPRQYHLSLRRDRLENLLGPLDLTPHREVFSRMIDAYQPIRSTRPSLPPLEEYVDEIRELWSTRWLTNRGTKHEQLTRELALFLESPRLSLCSNGHVALENVFEAMQLTGEVITTPFTFASTTHSIVRKGLTPVFCDVRAEDGTLDPDCIEALVTERTSAIVPVHIYGNLCRVHEIETIAKKHGLKVIYDAAHAFGSRWEGRSVTDFGDASTFSFHATKLFHTLEGGAVAFRDPALEKRFDLIRNFGITAPEVIEYSGGNSKMNEFQAAMGLCNLRELESSTAVRKLLFERYRSNLEPASHLRWLAQPQTNGSYVPVLFESQGRRDEVAERLKRHRIEARKYFYPLTNNWEGTPGGRTPQTTPTAWDLSNRVLVLPLHTEMSTSDIDRISRLVVREVS